MEIKICVRYAPKLLHFWDGYFLDVPMVTKRLSNFCLECADKIKSAIHIVNLFTASGGFDLSNWR